MKTRHQFFLILALLLLAGCSKAPNPTSLPDADGGLEAKESPRLTAQVRAGKLPPLEQRLPQNPLVVKPYEALGHYGGTWHVMVDNPDLGMYKMMNGYAPLIRWKADCSGLEPGTASSWEFNKDGTELTLHLRKGIKWSDGVEFTAEDLVYWGKLIHEGKQKFAKPFWSLVDGKEMVVTAPDKYTVVMKFAGPNWFAPLHLATGHWNPDEYNVPKHYMSQFDPAFNPKYKDYDTFDKKNMSHFNPERPNLWPWQLKAIKDGGFRMEFERNPYYYMTDPAGRQLPYIDRVEANYVPDTQVRVLKILSGEIDAQFRLIDLRDLSLYMEGRKRGGYRVLKWKEASGGNVSMILNWSPPDLELRKLMRDFRFRKALSHGIDRQKCSEVVWRGLTIPQQATVSREAWHFRSPEGKKVFDDWANSHTAFDLKLGNQLLDEMGLTKRDRDGVRLRPDGKRLSLMIDIPPVNAVTETDCALICADGWRKLGIDIVIKNWPGAEHDLRKRTGKFEVSNHGEAEMDLFTYPDWVFPTADNYWHAQIGKWYKSGGKEGEEPTGDMKYLLELYAKLSKEKDIEKAHKIIHEAIRFHTKQGLYTLGTSANPPSLVIVKNSFRNVPADPRVLGPWAVSGPATSYPESFFFAPKDWTPPATGTAKAARTTLSTAKGGRQ
jgi:peptide/nickel transport system substrate-binding protein